MYAVITTYQRPETLSAALASFSGYSKKYPRLSQVLILDDSSSAAIVEQNRAIVESFARQTGLNIRSVAAPEKRRFLEHVMGPDDSKAGEFAFFGDLESLPVPASGGNRNAGLLFSAGEKAVGIDDDTRMVFRKFSKLGSKYTDHGAQGPPVIFLPCGTEKRMDSLLTSAQPDIFHEFDTILGEPPPHKHSGDQVESDTVRIAMGGILGGRWYSNPHAYLDVDPRWQKKIWPNRTEYENAKTSPVSLLLAPEASVTQSPFFVTTCYGWDGRDLVPPFFPHLRSDDAVWSRMVRMCYPHSSVGHLPFAIAHDRNLRSAFSDNDFVKTGTTLSEFLLQFLEYVSPEIRLSDPGDILSAVGTRLSDLAHVSSPRLEEFLIDLSLRFQGLRIRRLSERLEESTKARRFWKDDMTKYLSEAAEAACSISSESWLPREFGSFTVREGEKLFRDYLARCGELLCAWPEIWDRAREARLAGELSL